MDEMIRLRFKKKEERKIIIRNVEKKKIMKGEQNIKTTQSTHNMSIDSAARPVLLSMTPHSVSSRATTIIYGTHSGHAHAHNGNFLIL